MKTKYLNYLLVVLILYSCNNEETKQLKPITYSSPNGEWVSIMDNLKVNYTEVTVNECNSFSCELKQYSTNSTIEYNKVIYNTSQNVRITKDMGYLIQVNCGQASINFYNCKINPEFTEITAEYAVLQINSLINYKRIETPTIKRIK